MKKEKESPPVIVEKIENREITQELRESYLDYAMSVIVSRALPDVRDGLKPVQRRILWAMWDANITAGSKPRKSAYVTGECFVKDTLITTTKGLIPIQQINVGDRVYTQTGIKPVKCLYIMPSRKLLKVVFSNGVSTTATPSQKFKVITPQWIFQWKEAKDLSVNDYVVTRNVYPRIKNPVAIGTFKNKTVYLNEGIAYLLGLFVSDGWISNDYGSSKHPRIGLVASDKKVLERIQIVLKEEFNYAGNIETRKYQISINNKTVTKKIFTFRINNLEINNFFSSHFNLKNKKAITKEIPAQIFQSPESIVFSFISGLIEGDGSISKTRNRIQYTSISQKLLNQISVLLSSFDITISICCNQNYENSQQKVRFLQGKVIKSRYPSYNLEVTGENAIALASRLQLIDSNKNQKLNRLKAVSITSFNRRGQNQYDIIPYASRMVFSELSGAHRGGGWYQDTSGQNFRMGIVYAQGTKIRYAADLLEKPLRRTQIADWGIKEKLEKIGSPLSSFITNTFENNIRFTKITSIENAAPEETYDLEVRDDHEFLANGMVVHNCMGKFHPHGDAAIYDALARMAQDFSLRYPLIIGQGNWGSIDGDSPAAQRYTECKLAPITEELLNDIDRETVDWQPNYDASRDEPKCLPGKLPALLLNGAVGIAVGMATSIPPHNLTEVANAIVHCIDNPDATSENLMEYIQGPDFPTGGSIYDKKAIREAYVSGHGPITCRGAAEIIEDDHIIITEIPYQVNKSELIIKMAELVTSKKIEGIRDIRDESDKDIRVVIEVKKDASAQKILNQLYQYTDLQKDFHMNLLALKNGLQPEVMSIREIILAYIEHRTIVVRRRTEFDLRKARERAHILEGLRTALDRIDEVIATIKKSKDRQDAFMRIIKKFAFSEAQANAILEMRLQTLAALEQQKIDDELKEKRTLIADLETLLQSPKKIIGVVKSELLEVKEKFGDARRTKVVAHGLKDFNEADLIPAEDALITFSHGGYIKRLPPDAIRSQHRGGKGLIGADVADEDFLQQIMTANTHDNVLFFTNRGRVFQTKAWEIPVGTRTNKGNRIQNFLDLPPDEKISSIVSYPDKQAGYLVMVTQTGIIKKTALTNFGNVRRSGIIAINLKKDDALAGAELSSGKDDIIISTAGGKAIRFKESQIRGMGRTAAGVIAIRRGTNDIINALNVITSEQIKTGRLLIVMEKGYGKQTKISEYKTQQRGGQGIKTAKITAKTGAAVSAHFVDKEESLFVLSAKGQIIRTLLNTVRTASRATQGVKIMNLSGNDKIIGTICL